VPDLYWYYKMIVGHDSVVSKRLAAGWKVRGSNPSEARFSASIWIGRGTHPASCTTGTVSLSQGQSSQGMAFPSQSKRWG